ncbi:MAG: hypothetical protein NTW22_07600, partial [Proteobacteria bacterium]|nr:hypothetical protein [Pseudomonadota bacterium]
VYISKAYNEVAQHKAGMIVKDFNWNNQDWNNQDWSNQDCILPSSSLSLDVRFRHGPAVHQATVKAHGKGDLEIILNQESKQGIAQGQFAVLYDGDICLGGGIITQAL